MPTKRGERFVEFVYTLFVYPKSKQATLTEDERAAVRRLVERLKS